MVAFRGGLRTMCNPEVAYDKQHRSYRKKYSDRGAALSPLARAHERPGVRRVVRREAERRHIRSRRTRARQYHASRLHAPGLERVDRKGGTGAALLVSFAPCGGRVRQGLIESDA